MRAFGMSVGLGKIVEIRFNCFRLSIGSCC